MTADHETNTHADTGKSAQGKENAHPQDTQSEGTKLTTQWQTPPVDLNLRALLCLIYPLTVAGACCIGFISSMSISTNLPSFIFMESDYRQAISTLSIALDEPAGTILVPDELDLVNSGHQEVIPELDKLRQFRMEGMEDIDLLVAPYDDNKVQGIYGEPVRLVFKEGANGSEMFFHMFGANGVDDGGKSDDYFESASITNNNWETYKQPYVEAYSRHRILRFFSWSIPVTMVFALFFYFVICRNIWMLYFHFDKKALQRDKYSVTTWLRVILTIAYTACFYTFINSTMIFVHLYQSNQWYYILFSSLYIGSYFIYMISIFLLPIYGIFVLIKIKKRNRRNKLLNSGHCPRCEYDLRISIQEKFNCPECDLELERLTV